MSRFPSFPPPPPPSSDGKSPREPEPPAQRGNPPPARQPRLTLWLIWLATAVVLIWILYGFFAPAPSRVTLTYDQFLAQVAAGNVSQVSIKDQSVTGKLRTAIAQ